MTQASSIRIYLRTIWHLFLCWIGLHDWHTSYFFVRGRQRRYCLRDLCNAKQERSDSTLGEWRSI